MRQQKRWQNLAEYSLARSVVLAVPFNPSAFARQRARCSLHPSKAPPMTPGSPKIVYGQPLSRPIAFSLACADHCRTSHRTFPTTSYLNSLADPIASFPTGFPRRFDGAIALANELQEEVSSG